MPWFEDLTPCRSFRVDEQHAAKFIAVGWLRWGNAYHRGEVDSEVIEKLVELMVQPWSPPMRPMGRHNCDLCRLSEGPQELIYRKHPWSRTKTRVGVGYLNLFVPGQDVLYASPSLMLHYIDSHEYAPPAIFCEAVLACPPMGSEDYLQAIISNGPPEFARWARETPR